MATARGTGGTVERRLAADMEAVGREDERERRKGGFTPLRLLRYVVLTLGALVMIIPFAWMVSTAF